MAVFTDLVIAKAEQIAEITEDINDTKFTYRYIGNSVPVDWFMGLLCVLSKRTYRGIGVEFPILIDEHVRVTRISNALVTLAANIDDGSIPDIAQAWANWMMAHGDKIVGANETPANRKNLRVLYRQGYFEIQSDYMLEHLLTIKLLSKQAICNEKWLLLRHCP